MTLGTDSYVTLVEANDYIANFHSGSAWDTLTDAQKEQRLVLACERLEALPFSGRKAGKNQTLSFPRFPNTTVPESIKAAQVEIALLSVSQSGLSAEAAQRVNLQRQGVTSFSIGDLSESYGGQSGLVEDHAFLANAEIHALLNRFLQGGYPIC